MFRSVNRKLLALVACLVALIVIAEVFVPITPANDIVLLTVAGLIVFGMTATIIREERPGTRWETIFTAQFFASLAIMVAIGLWSVRHPGPTSMISLENSLLFIAALAHASIGAIAALVCDIVAPAHKSEHVPA